MLVESTVETSNISKVANNSVKTISNPDATYILPTISEIKRSYKKTLKKINSISRKRKGYFLIGLFFWAGILLLVAMMDPMLITALNLKEKLHNIAVKQSWNLAVSTTAPIRAQLVDDVYKRVQTQLIDHISKSKGSIPYQCQGTLVQPATTDPNGGKLDNQFGLCQPETLLDGLNGLTNQKIDWLPAIYPEYQKQLTGKNEIIRQAIIRQNQNKYDYKLTVTYVGQENLNDTATKGFKTQTGIKRTERYHYMVRADVENYAYRGIIKPSIANYDVWVVNNYYPQNFGGGGNSCDKKYMPPVECPPTSLATGVSDCVQQGYTSSNGTYYSAGEGPCPLVNEGYGTGECRRIADCKDYGPYIACPLAGGGQAITAKAPRVRIQVGCASLNSGKSGKIIDDSGYSFALTVRLLSITNIYD